MQATGNNQNQTYNLSIRLRADGLSFYGYNTALAVPVVMEHYPFAEGKSAAETLEEAIAGSPLLQGGVAPVVYGLVKGPSMQIPLECFRKEEVHALYRLTYAQDKTGKTYYNILPHLEIAQIFTIEPDVERTLCQHFPGIRFYHQHSMMLEKIWMMEQQEQPRLYAYFDESEMFIFCYKDQRLQYANTFPADVASNAAYFLLSVWKGLELDVHTTPCFLLGQGSLKDAAAQQLGRFLKDVRNTSATDIFRRSTLARNPQVPLDLLALLVHVI